MKPLKLVWRASHSRSSVL